MNLRPVLLAVLAAVSCPALADGAPGEFDPVVVTATLAESQLSRTLAPVIVITRAEIEREQPLDVADLLRFHAGLDVARNGGPGQPASVFIRGADSNHTLVLVDGVRINPGTIGGAAFQDISPEDIERIEIVKGPRSSQWGSDAIGGVVNIITRRPARGLTAEASAMGGSDATWNAAAGLAQRGERFEGGFNVDQFDTRGFPAQASATEDTGHHRLSFDVSGAAPLGSARVSARHWQAQGRTDYDDFSGTRVDEDFQNSASVVESTFPLGGPFSGRAALTRATDEIHQNQSTDYAVTRRTGAELGSTWTGDGMTATVGAQATREVADSLVFGSGFDVHTDAWAAFAQHTADFGAHHSLLAVRYSHHEAFGSHVTGELEYGYDAWRGGRVVALAGTAFRAPDATDRFGFGGDPTLKPETARSYELGLRQQLGEAQAVSVSAFRNRIDDLIEFICADAFCFTGQNRNVAHARIQGVEAAWRWRPGLWSGTVEGIVQDPIDQDTGERLARRAGKSLTASVSRELGALTAGVDALAQGRREDSAFSATVNPGYALLNATLGWRAVPGLALQGRVENVLDTDYVTAAGFNSPGRAFFLTLRYALR